MVSLLLAFVIIGLLLKRPDIIKSVQKYLIFCFITVAGISLLSVIGMIVVALIAI